MSTQHDNVWFVTNEQLLDWMQQPAAISDLDTLDVLQCPVPDVPDDICNGMTPNQAGLLMSCSFDALSWGAASCYGCPASLPTVNEPTPDQDLSDGRSARHAVPDDCATAWCDPIAGECLCAGGEIVFLAVQSILYVSLIMVRKHQETTVHSETRLETLAQAKFKRVTQSDPTQTTKETVLALLLCRRCASNAWQRCVS